MRQTGLCALKIAYVNYLTVLLFFITGSVEVQSGESISLDITGDLGISSETITWLSFLVRLKESHFVL